MLCMGYLTIENVSQPAAIDGILDQDRYIDILSKELISWKKNYTY